MRPLATPHFIVVEVGLGPIATQDCCTPEVTADEAADFFGRDSHALRREPAGTESKGYARLNRNQLARLSLSSSNSDSPGLDARVGAGGNCARELFS